jgi:hypothetical protein
MDLALLISKLSFINHEKFDCEKEISTKLIQESTLTFLASRKHVLEGFTVSKKCKITRKIKNPIIAQFTQIKIFHTRKSLLVKYLFTSKG